MTRPPKLDVEPGFQRREWRAESIGWVLLGVLLLLAVAGAAGAGVLSWATATSDRGSVSLQFERVEHREADATLTLTLRSSGAGAQDAAVMLTGGWLDAVDLRGVVPQPAEQVSTAGGLQLRFPVAGASEVRVSLSYRAQRTGLLRGGVAAAGESVAFWQLVLP